MCVCFWLLWQTIKSLLIASSQPFSSALQGSEHNNTKTEWQQSRILTVATLCIYNIKGDKDTVFLHQVIFAQQYLLAIFFCLSHRSLLICNLLFCFCYQQKQNLRTPWETFPNKNQSYIVNMYERSSLMP